MKLLTWISRLFQTPEQKLLQDCQTNNFYLGTLLKTVNPNEIIRIGQSDKFSPETLIDVNQQDEQGNTLLHYLGTTYWCCDLGAYLLTKGANANILNNNGETPLKKNIHNCYTDSCLALIQATNQKNLNRIYPDGETILTDWIQKLTLFWNTKIIHTFLANGADPSLPNEKGHTPLYYLACQLQQVDNLYKEGFLNAFVLLSENGATFTPSEIKELCVLKKIRSNPMLILGLPKDYQQDTQNLIHDFVYQCDRVHFGRIYSTFLTNDESNKTKELMDKVMDKIIQITPDINQPNENGETPLLLAIKKYGLGQLFAQKLIQAGADISVKNPQTQETLLHGLRNTQLLEMLLDLEQIDVNAVDNAGNTALHYATLHNDRAIISKLLQAGADCDIQNNDGLTVFDIARTQHPTTAQMLRLIELETENKKLKQIIASQRLQPTPTGDKVNEG